MIAREEVLATTESETTATGTVTATAVGTVTWSFASPTAMPAPSAASASGSIALQRYEYTGRELASESSGYYFRYRVYAPELGQFFTRDPLGYKGGIALNTGYFAQGGGVDPWGLRESYCTQCDCRKLPTINGRLNQYVNAAIAAGRLYDLTAQETGGGPVTDSVIEMYLEGLHEAEYTLRPQLTDVFGFKAVADCSRVRCGTTEYCIGTDKIGHFFQQGHMLYEVYLDRQRAGVHNPAIYATAFGLWTEGLIETGRFPPEVYKWLSGDANIDFRQFGFGFIADYRNRWGGPNLRLELATGFALEASTADMAANSAGFQFWRDFAKNPNLTFDICRYINSQWQDWVH